MKTLPNNYYDDIATKWVKDFHANASYNLDAMKEDYAEICSTIISKSVAKNPNVKVIVIVDCYETRSHVVDVCKKAGITETNYTCLSADYIKSSVNYRYNIAIYINLNTISGVNCVISRTKFNLFIINNVTAKKDKFAAKDRAEIYAMFPAMNEAKVADVSRFTLPVEEIQIPCYLDDADKTKYDEYCNYISSCISIFGNLETIDFARVGNKITGESAEQVRRNIASYNGWHENLDKNSPFDKQIDEYFNPIVIEEKATAAYNIMRERKNLLTDNKAKFNVVVDLLKNELVNKKVLIVSKRAEFAALITECLLDNDIACGDYHDKAAPKAIIDEETGDYIRYKTGAKAGDIKLFKSAALSSINLKRFNLDPNSGSLTDAERNTLLYILSMKNRSSDALETNVDAVIFTTPFNDTIEEFIYRFNGISFNGDSAKIYKLYMVGTLEEKELEKEKQSVLHSIVKRSERANFFISND